MSAKPSGPVKPVVTATPGNASVTLKWAAVPGASRYAVARQVSGGYHTYTCGCRHSYTVTGLENGKTYKFLVQSNVNGAWSSFDSSDLVSRTPSGSGYSIMGESTCSVEQMVARYNATVPPILPRVFQ